MKLGKKIVAVFMVFLTIAMIFPFSAFAAENSAAELINDEYSVEGTNTLGNILTQLADKKTSGEPNDTENKIIDLSVDDNNIYVQYIAKQEALLLVAFYAEGSQQLLNSVKTVIDPSKNEIYINRSQIDLPEYFIVKAYILEKGTLKALSEEYTSPYYTSVFEDFFSKTIYDFDEEEVINLDNNPANNFVVLKDGAVTVEATKTKNILHSYNEETGEYIISNPDSELLTLKEDGVLHYIYGSGEDDFDIISVKSIEKTDGRIKITPQSAAPEDVLQYVRIESAVTTSDDEYMPADEYQAYTTCSVGKANARGTINYNKYLATIPETEVGVSPEFKLGDENNVIYGSAKAKFSVIFKLYFALSIDYYTLFGIPTPIIDEIEPYTDFKFSVKMDVDLSITAVGKAELYKKKLPEISIPILPGIDFVGEPTFEASFSAAITVSFNLIRESGATYKSGEGVKEINKSDTDFEPELKSEIEIKVGFEMEMGIRAIKIFTLSLSGGFGVKAKGTPWRYELSADIKHLCPTCIEIEVSLYGDIGIVVDIGVKKVWKFEVNMEWRIVDVRLLEVEIPILEGYCSNYTGRFELVWGSKCPHTAYRVTFTVVDKDSKPISGASVDKLTTNSNGAASDFYEDDKQYTVAVTASGYEGTSKTFDINSKPLQISITLFKEDEEKPEDPDTPDDPPVVPGKITWSYNSGTKTLSISGSGDIDDYWSYSDAPWHQHYLEAETIKMSEGITRIGDYAFAQFRKVTNVKIPSTVKSIGEGAFYGCERIPEIIIGDKVETIGDYAFYYCANAAKLEIGKSVKTIGSYAFAQCVALTDVTVPSSVNSIGDYAFAWDKNIVRIAILNPACKIYNSSDVIPSTAIIAGYSGSTAQTHANRYGHTFSKLVLMDRAVNNGIATVAAVDYNAKKHNAKCGNTIEGEYYVILVLNTALNGSDFTTDQLLYIDQVTADASGKIEVTFIPRTSENCKVYIIGDFSDGSSAKEVSAEIVYDTENCSCKCHKNGIAKFFFKLLLFFQKIFRTNKTCKCGISHY